MIIIWKRLLHFISVLLLKVYLKTLSTNFRGIRDTVSIFDAKDFMLSLSPNERLIISEACVLLKLILVMSSTNTVSERSFSKCYRICKKGCYIYPFQLNAFECPLCDM